VEEEIEVVAKAQRRRFTVAYKRQVLEKAARCTKARFDKPREPTCNEFSVTRVAFPT